MVEIKFLRIGDQFLGNISYNLEGPNADTVPRILKKLNGPEILRGKGKVS